MTHTTTSIACRFESTTVQAMKNSLPERVRREIHLGMTVAKMQSGDCGVGVYEV